MEFENLKDRCNYQYCNQVCYLPLSCQSCSKKYCEKHKHEKAHDCSGESVGSKMVVKCPICLELLKYTNEQIVDDVVSEHILAKGCVALGPKAHQDAKDSVQRCHANKCLAKLTSLNKIQCKRCRQWHCLKHRFEDDHSCDPSAFFEQNSQGFRHSQVSVRS